MSVVCRSLSFKSTMSNFELPRNVEHYLAVLSKLYLQEGQKQKQEIIVNSQIRVHEEWSYDNWGGGTFGHAIYLAVPEDLYLTIIRQRDELQNQIKDDMNKVHNVQNEFVAAVFIEAEIAEDKDWRRESGVLLSPKIIVSQEAEKRIWSENGFRIFLSHKSEVKEKASELKRRLEEFGISCFVAHDDIHPTKEWQDEIEDALFSMDAFLAFMTDGFHDSDWTDQEVGVAFGRGVPIVSLKLGKDPYGFIGKFQALSCPWDAVPKEIVKIFIKHGQMLNAYMTAVENCKSFDDGNRLAEILPYIDKLSNEQVNRLLSAFNDNIDVRGSFGFNGTKPVYFGKGLIFHLARVTGKKFGLALSGNLELTP